MPPSSAIILTTTLRLRTCVLEALAGIGTLFTFIVTIVIELLSEVMDVETRLIAPADYIDFYGDPFNVVSTAAPQPWKGKGKLILRKDVPTVVKTDENVDWTKYDPPDALRTAPTVTSDILLQLITSSIDKVKTRVAEEDRVKRQQSNARRQREEALRREAEEALSSTKGKEPYLPIIIPEEPPTPEEPKSADATFDDFLHSDLSGNGEGSSSGAPLIVFQPAKPKKNHRFKFARLLGRKKSDSKDRVTALMAADLHRNSIYGNPYENILSTTTSNVSRGTLESGTLAPVPEPQPEPEPAPVEQVECVSCLDDFPVTETIKAPCHHYCHECFERLITAACANEQQWPPKCCLNDIPVRTIRAHIPETLVTSYNDRSAEWSSPVADRIYCSRRDCSLFVPPSRIDRASRIARCPSNHRTCTLCREEFHDNRECPRDRDYELTEALAEEEGWLHCGRCRALVEHREACQHMTCRCGYEFCYVCSAVWQTCRCSMADLNQKKEQVQARRDRRLVLEAEAEAELQEALRQIEEFEREEALKAELLRQEQERQEEERRQRELEERIRVEGIRRRDVEIKFAELRGVLADLHGLQRVLVGHEQTKNAENLVEETKTSKDSLGKKHEADRAELDAKVAGKLADKEAVFLKEYAVRVAQERTVEEAYLLQLRDFYAGKKGAEDRVAAEMMRFRKKMDKGWRTWSCWRDDELAAYRAKVEEERTIKDELMFSAELRLNEGLEERANDLERKKKADAQWVELVIAERERMLDEAEVEELDNGDDAASLFASSDDGSGCA